MYVSVLYLAWPNEVMVCLEVLLSDKLSVLQAVLIFDALRHGWLAFEQWVYLGFLYWPTDRER